MRLRSLAVSLFGLALCIAPAVSEELPARAESVLRKSLEAMATRQTYGGWGRAYTEDGSIMWGEYRPIPLSWITIQPPATPKVAEVYLRAALVLGEDAFADRAQRARDAILAVQTAEGGFPYEADPAGPRAKAGTFDDDVTTGALGFLVRWWQFTKQPEDLAVVHRVGNFLLAAQYPDSGGWPQVYPPPARGYGRYITFNDDNISNIIASLLQLYELTGDERYFSSAKRGGECILALQGGPGEEIWAQQYDPETIKPAWARKFEPPGYSPTESIGVCNTLIELFLATGEDRFLTPLPKAFAWYEAHRLPNGKWARLYEPGTQRPVYGRRDKAEKVYDVEKACTGYGWQGDWYPIRAKEAFERIQAIGRDAYRAQREQTKPPTRTEELEKRVQEICDALSPDGWWLSAPVGVDLEECRNRGLAENTKLIDTGVFCRNAGMLLGYLEAVRRQVSKS